MYSLRPGRFNLIVTNGVSDEEVEELRDLLSESGLLGVIVDGDVNVIELS